MNAQTMEAHNKRNNALFSTVEKEVANHFSEKLAPVVTNMEHHYFELRERCKTDEDIKLLERLFRKVNMRGFEIYFPHKSVTLSIRQIFRLLDLGFDIIDNGQGYNLHAAIIEEIPPTPFYARAKAPVTRRRITRRDTSKPNAPEVEIPESDWDIIKLKRSFYTPDYRSLFRDYDEAKKALEEMFSERNRKEYLLKCSEVADGILSRIDELRADVHIPTLDEVRKPVPLELRESIFDEADGATVSASLSEESKRTMTLQRRGVLPSLFNPDSHKRIGRVRQNVIIILDISNSTEVGELYKIIDLVAAQVSQTLLKFVKNVNVQFVAYSNSAKLVPSINGFILPDGGTFTSKGFSLAISEFHKLK